MGKNSVPKKILITGAEGFLGSYLTHYLLKNGYGVVVSVKDPVWRPLLKEAIKKNNLEVYYGSVLTRKGRKEIIPYLKDVDTIIHLERNWGGEDIQNGLYKEINNNLLGTIEFIKLAYQFVNKVIFTSSMDVYGDLKKLPLKEEYLSNPSSFYSITKYSTEQYLYKIAERFEKKLIVLRISTIYGPYDIDDKAVPNFIKAILKNKPPVLRNRKAIYRDFIYIEDVCAAIALTVKKNSENNTTINIASGKAISLEEMIDKINTITGKNKGPIKHKIKSTVKYLVDTSKAKRLLGFFPKFNLNKGLKIEIDWFIKYLQSNGEL